MIQLAQIQREVAQIVAEAPPGFRYTRPDGDTGTCRNVRLDEHGTWIGDCLLGIWIIRFPGALVKDVPAQMSNWCPRMGLRSSLSALAAHRVLDVEISELALEWGQYVQGEQDNAHSWTSCLERADAWMESGLSRNSDDAQVYHNRALY